MAGPSRTPRVLFTEQDRDYMVKFLSKYTSDPQGRSGNEIWKTLVENRKGKWNWSQRHSWQSWRNHYAKDRDWFDRKIRRYQVRHPEVKPLPSPRRGVGSPRTKRVAFTDEDDRHLAKYLAEYSISGEGRLGRRLYTVLVENEHGKWPWSERHTVHSWRERYSNNRDAFDKYILRHQRDNSPLSVFETPAGPRKHRKGKARAEDDESIPEEAEEEDGAEGVQQAEEEDEVEEAIQQEESGGDVEGAAELSASNRNHGSPQKRKRSTSDDAGSREKTKRRRVEPLEDAQRSSPNAVEAVDDAGDANQAGSDDEEAQPKATHGLRGEEEAVGAPPSDDYTGNIFDASESNDSDTEDEEDAARELPPIAVQQEEEEEEEDAGEEEEDEEEEDQLASSVSPAQKQLDVDADARGNEKRELSVSPSPSPSGTPTPVFNKQEPKDRLYPSLPSPYSRDEDIDNPPVPGQFPATSVPDDGLGVSTLFEAIPRAHELRASQKEQIPVISAISQAPTPPASSPPADVNPPLEHDTVVAPAGASQARDTSPEAGPSNVDATPRPAHTRPPRAKTYKRKPAEDIFASVPPTPSAASSRDVTPATDRPKRPRDPPRLADGPFNHVFTGAVGKRLNGARITGVTDDADSDIEEVWPPRRGRSKGKEKEQQQEQVERLPPAASAPEVKVEPQSQATALQQLRTLPASTHHPFSQPTQDVEASQVLYLQVPQGQSQHHPFSQPSQVVDTESQQAQSFRLPRAHLERLEQELKKSGHLQQEQNERRASFATSTPIRRTLKQPSDVPVLGPLTVQENIVEGPSRSSDFGRSVRFESSILKNNDEGKNYGPPTPHVNGRRHTVSGDTGFEAPSQDDRPHTDHIRVRQSFPLLPSALHGVRSADDSLIGAGSTSISFRRPLKRESLSFVQQPKPRSASAEPEPPLQISEDDESMVVHIGVETAIQTMSENHGFNPDIVRRVWTQTQSLRKTDAVLRRMREAAEKAALQLMGGVDDADDADDRPLSGSRSRGLARSVTSRRSSYKRDSSSILRITPTEADRESVEYSPPRPARVAQYALSIKGGKQGKTTVRGGAFGASPMGAPQRDTSETGYQASRSSPEAAVDERHPIDGGKVSTATWMGGVPDQASSREVPLGSGRTMKGDAAKIALGKKLGRMLANVGV